MVDLHTHILPRVDDGPSEEAESLAILSRLGRMGFAHVFLTPHFPFPVQTGGMEEMAALVEERVRSLGLAAAGEAAGIILHPGMEYPMDEDLPAWARRRPGGGSYVLLDLGFGLVPRNTRGVMGRLRSAGLSVLVVHPERNPGLASDRAALSVLMEEGAGFLGNLGSLSGLYGKGPREAALDFLARGVYWAFASDIHSLIQLSAVERGLEELSRRADRSFDSLVKDNPLAVVRERKGA